MIGITFGIATLSNVSAEKYFNSSYYESNHKRTENLWNVTYLQKSINEIEEFLVDFSSKIKKDEYNKVLSDLFLEQKKL